MFSLITLFLDLPSVMILNLFSINSVLTGSKSNITADLPFLRAAAPVVPLPPYKSQTFIPGLVKNRIKNNGICSFCGA